MRPAVFETAIPASEPSQTQALGRSATGIGLKPKHVTKASGYLPHAKKDSSPDAMLLISNAGFAEESETNTIHSYSRLSVYVLPSLLLLETQSACNTSW